jgi:mercuric ion transport protein
MRTAWGAMGTAFAASLCCIGPVLGVLVGAGATGAMASRLTPFRPLFLVATVACLGFGFYTVYRPGADACDAEGHCDPRANRRAKVLLWTALVVAVVFIAFPWYVKFII